MFRREQYIIVDEPAGPIDPALWEKLVKTVLVSRPNREKESRVFSVEQLGTKLEIGQEGHG